MLAIVAALSGTFPHGPTTATATSTAFFGTRRRQILVPMFTKTRVAFHPRPSPILRAASSSKAAVDYIPKSSLYPSLLGKNLVSIEDCLEAWGVREEILTEQERRGDGRGGWCVEGGCGGLAFVDGSWYHRGGRDGREE